MNELNAENFQQANRALRVLIVDDEPPIARLTALLLKSTGAYTEIHSRAADAIEASRVGTFDVIISDIVMPEMNGLGLLKAVRGFDLDIPIILLTGTPSIETAKQAVELGAFRYLTKPTSKDELTDAVCKAAFAHRMAKLKREAASLAGGIDDTRAGDLSGLLVAFEATMAELWMAYQPIVRANSGQVFSYEALMRSRSSALPHPGAILEAAERLNKLHVVGQSVREKSAESFQKMEDDVLLFVNLHPQDLLDPDLLDPMRPLSQIAHRVVLELTERASLDNLHNVNGTVGQLRDLGFRIAVDDLGAGYAGLTSFATLEPDFVKLDMTLIRGIDKNTMLQKLVRSMAELCSDLGIQVVAEGIETREERDCCVELGVDLLQGYFMAKPGEPFPEVNW